jgi:hypothetical protein
MLSIFTLRNGGDGGIMSYCLIPEAERVERRTGQHFHFSCDFVSSRDPSPYSCASPNRRPSPTELDLNPYWCMSSEGGLSLMVTLTNQYKSRATCMGTALSWRRRNATATGCVELRRTETSASVGMWETEITGQGLGDLVGLQGSFRDRSIVCQWRSEWVIIEHVSEILNESFKGRQSEGVTEWVNEFSAESTWLLESDWSDEWVEWLFCDSATDCTSDR